MQPIPRALWAVLEPLVDHALELPPDQRAAYIADLRRADPANALEVERLVVRAEQRDERNRDREREAGLVPMKRADAGAEVQLPSPLIAIVSATVNVVPWVPPVPTLSFSPTATMPPGSVIGNESGVGGELWTPESSK